VGGGGRGSCKLWTPIWWSTTEDDWVRMDDFRHEMAGNGEETETFFVLAEQGGAPVPGRTLHRDMLCGYLLAGATREGREIAVVHGDPEDWLQTGGHCVCSHCRMSGDV